MADPLFWLGLSIFLVALSLTVVLVVALPALRELSRAARSAEKLFDTLNRELPPTLEAIRLTGMEMSELTDDMSEGVQSAGQLVKQVEQGLSSTRRQAQKVQTATRSFWVGAKAAWKTFTRRPSSRRRSRERHLPVSSRSPIDLEDRQKQPHTTRRPPKGWEDSPQKGLSECLIQPAERLNAYEMNGQADADKDETGANPLESISQPEKLGPIEDGGAVSESGGAVPESSETAPR